EYVGSCPHGQWMRRDDDTPPPFHRILPAEPGTHAQFGHVTTIHHAPCSPVRRCSSTAAGMANNDTRTDTAQIAVMYQPNAVFVPVRSNNHTATIPAVEPSKVVPML